MLKIAYDSNTILRKMLKMNITFIINIKSTPNYNLRFCV